MSNQPVETSVFAWGDRHLPAQVIQHQASTLQASGVVDSLSIPDHMVNLIPPSLWTTDHTPMARILKDPDSLMDAVVMGMLAHSAAPGLHLNFCGDAVRKSPADLCQLMWTMAAITQGRVRFQYGPGEAKNLNPYGHKRAQGLARFEDLLRMSHALWHADGPIDLIGNHWEFKQAYLGGAKTHRPEIWSMGTGPKQVELATTFCDGLTASIPNVWTTPDHARTEIDQIKQALIQKGRDPESVGFGAFSMIICHEDPAVVSRALDNPIIRWLSAVVGRLKSPEEFRKEGIEPATPDGWVYFMKLLPYATAPDFVAEVLAKASRRMAERSFICGSPAQVADQISAFLSAGITSVNLMDFAPLILEPDDSAKSLERMIQVCSRLKGNA